MANNNDKNPKQVKPGTEREQESVGHPHPQSGEGDKAKTQQDGNIPRDLPDADEGTDEPETRAGQSGANAGSQR